MLRKVIRIILICFLFYLGFWLYQNLDFDSVISSTGDELKHELSIENLKDGFSRLQEALK